MVETKASTLLRALGFQATIVDLISPLRRDECVRRLRERVDGTWTFFSLREVIGWIDEMTFKLSKRIVYANPYQTVLRGTFVDESRQTRIQCRFGLHPSVRAGTLIWLALAVATACFVMWQAVSPLLLGAPFARNPTLLDIVIPSLVPCIGLAVVVIGRLLARGEQQFLLEFLTKQLDARETPAVDR